MSKIMELADTHVQLSRHYNNPDAPEVKKARAALAEEVEKLEQQVNGISIALTNANKVLDSVVNERDALREKLAVAQTANNLLDQALLAAHPQGAEGVVYEYWNEARKFMEASK